MPKTICITGIDGAGKSTLVDHLASRFSSVSVAAIWDAMNSEDSPFSSKKAVDAYLCSLTPDSRLLFLAHALQYSTEKALVAKTAVVLLNSYYYKYFATELTLGASEKLVQTLIAQFPKPDLCMRLEVPVTIAAHRKKQLSRYECGLAEQPGIEPFISFQQRNLESWNLFRTTDFITIDATLPVESMCNEAYAHIPDSWK